MALVCRSAASPVIAASMCGTIPSVQPKAATTAARVPRDRPAASVTKTPVPGEATIIRDVIRNSIVIFESSLAERGEACGSGGARHDYRQLRAMGSELKRYFKPPSTPQFCSGFEEWLK
jgi:hypothetical protein